MLWGTSHGYHRVHGMARCGMHSGTKAANSRASVEIASRPCDTLYPTIHHAMASAPCELYVYEAKMCIMTRI